MGCLVKRIEAVDGYDAEVSLARYIEAIGMACSHCILDVCIRRGNEDFKEVLLG